MKLTVVRPALLDAISTLDLTHYSEAQAPLGFSSLLCQLFGYPAEVYDAPTLCAAYEGLPARAMCLYADPVYLLVDRAHVYGLGRAYADLSLNEAQEFADYLNSQLQGVEVTVSPSGQWYVRSDRVLNVRCYEVEEIMAHSLIDRMPRGEDAGFLVGVYNQIQMLLHDCHLNKLRVLQGKSSIDALWFYGGGMSLKKIKPSRWKAVITTQVFAQALARLNDIPCIKISEIKSVGKYLCVDEECAEIDNCVKMADVLYVGHGKVFKRRRWWKG